MNIKNIIFSIINNFQNKYGIFASEMKAKSKKIKHPSRFNSIISIVVLLFVVVNLEASPKKVLIFMSSADTLILDEDREYPTGVFLNEFYIPYKMLKEKGYEFDFATLDGKKATIDPESIKTKYWENENVRLEAIEFTDTNSSFQNPKSIDNLKNSELEYSGIIIPGGQGLMVDLITNKNIRDLLTKFHLKNKSIGLICHAPAILTTYPKDSNPFEGYKINSVTGVEEWFIEIFVMKGTPKVRKIADRLEESGLIYEKSFLPGRPYAVKDRNLVSSQNPFSGIEFMELYSKSLEEYP